MSDTITVAAPPLTADVATAILAAMATQSGTMTDYNVGSQIRTLSEAIGSVVEQSGIETQARAFQAMVYGAFAAFGIVPYVAVSAVGTITFSTGTGGSPPPAVQTYVLPAGIIVSTVSGIQFQTTQSVTIAIGDTAVNAPIQALQPGAIGNVSTNSITQLDSGVAFGPLVVTNSSPTTGGSDAETPAQTLGRFAAVVAETPASSPVAIANACIGVVNPGTAETVAYATVYEPWIAESVGSQVAGYQILVDNGSGGASSGLLAAVATKVNPNFTTGYIGYRDAGVPYSVGAVTPLNCSLTVTGTAVQSSLDASLNALAVQAATAYFQALNFGIAAQQGDLNAVIANAVAGSVTGLVVTLKNSSGTSVSSVAPTAVQRIIPTSIASTIT